MTRRHRNGLPKGWSLAQADDGRTYYIDHVNKTTTWLHPKLSIQQKIAKKQGVPLGWEKATTTDGVEYFINHEKQKTYLDLPRHVTNPLQVAFRNLLIVTSVIVVSGIFLNYFNKILRREDAFFLDSLRHQAKAKN